MDFLDPRNRKLHSIRLMIGYSLMSVMIFIATLILVYRAYGFDVDRKTGQVIQNGLVYVDSAPDRADIYIDNKLQNSKTNSRLILAEGDYNLAIKRDGYRDWNRRITVTGGGILRITYPMLIQTNLVDKESVILDSDASIIRTQSPDRRWIMATKAGEPRQYSQVDLKNVNKTTGIPTTSQITFPDELFTPGDQSSIEIVEWSNDNQHFLVKHSFAGQSEFVMLNRDQPDTSFNINKLLGLNPDSITMRDKKFDQWYLQDKTTGDITFANARKEVALYQKSVQTYKSYSDNIVLFSQELPDKTTGVYLRQDNEVRLLNKIKAGKVLLDITKYDNTWFAVVSSDQDKKTYVYKNPWNFLSKTTASKPVPQAILHHNNGPVSKLSFSANARFIFARDGQHFGVYDAETDKTYSYDFNQPIDTDSEVYWMDGHRLLARSNGVWYFVEYDDLNQQKLISSLPGKSLFFDRDYTAVYSLQNSKSQPSKIALFSTDLRYAQDK